MQQQNHSLRRALIFISLLVMAMLGAVLFIFRQNKLLTRRRHELSAANTQLSALNGQLKDANGQLSMLKIVLVSGDMLADVAGELGIGELILLGESERGTGARGMRKALEDVYEALVGALYIDGGYDAAHDFVVRTLHPRITPDLGRHVVPAKSRLQEVIQRDFRVGPEYKLVDESGPAHSPTFTSVVLVEGRRVGRGTGSSKKESQTNAALDALVRMGYEEGDGTPEEEA